MPNAASWRNSRSRKNCSGPPTPSIARGRWNPRACKYERSPRISANHRLSKVWSSGSVCDYATIWIQQPKSPHRLQTKSQPRLDGSHRIGERRELYATQVGIWFADRVSRFLGDRRDSCCCGHSPELQFGRMFMERDEYCARADNNQGWCLLSCGVLERRFEAGGHDRGS